MSVINVTPLAQAAVARKLNPQYTQGLYYYQFGVKFGLNPLDFVDNATAAEMASLLGGTVLQLLPRSTWCNAIVNNTPLVGLPPQNFIAFADQPGAPSPNAVLVINGGDLAQAAEQGSSVLPQEVAKELLLSYLIPGSTMSQAAQDALPSSPVASLPAQPVYWFTPSA